VIRLIIRRDRESMLSSLHRPTDAPLTRSFFVLANRRRFRVRFAFPNQARRLSSTVMSGDTIQGEKPKRLVSLWRDNEDFVITFQPEDVIIFRNPDASALREICNQLRWKITSNTVHTVDDI
jgi:hypothetical protein